MTTKLDIKDQTQQITVNSEYGFDSQRNKIIKQGDHLFKFVGVVEESYCFEIDGITYRDGDRAREEPDREWYETKIEVIVLTPEEEKQLAQELEEAKQAKRRLETEEKAEVDRSIAHLNAGKDKFRLSLEHQANGEKIWAGYDLPKESWDSDSPAILEPDKYDRQTAGNGLGLWCDTENLEKLFEYIRSKKPLDFQEVHERLTVYKNCAGSEYYHWLLARGYVSLRHPKPCELKFQIGDPLYKGSKSQCVGYQVSQSDTWGHKPITWHENAGQWEFEDANPVLIDLKIEFRFS